jgi:TRAP-type C4-dicarboxylate transport system permease large subunit
MLAGEVMNAGGLSRRIVDFALALGGPHVAGGLGLRGHRGSACLLAALSGSAVADAAALGRLVAAHDGRRPATTRRAAVAVVAAGRRHCARSFRPPSRFVIFGVAANVVDHQIAHGRHRARASCWAASSVGHVVVARAAQRR